MKTIDRSVKANGKPWAVKNAIESRAGILGFVWFVAAFAASQTARADYMVCQPGLDGGVPFAVKCACEGTLHCFAPEDRDDPETQLGAPEGAPTGDYQCCHTGRTCGELQGDQIVSEDAPGCSGPNWPCLIGEPCATGPGACHGVCRGREVSVSEPGTGTLVVTGAGSYCDAPMPGQNPETCNGIDDDCDGIIDNVREGSCGDDDLPPEPESCNPDENNAGPLPPGGSPFAGDPVHVGGGASYQRIPDVKVQGSIDTYALLRS